MTRLGQLMRPHSMVRSCGLLVCALLLGLLGMHGLGPMPGVTASSSAHEQMAVVAHTDVTASMPGECDHGGGGCTGHTDHADPACASASVAGTPLVVPVLLPDAVARAASQALTSSAGSGPDGGRAPPSLSELQLLRI